MRDLTAELMELELDDLDLDSLEIQNVEREKGLESLTTGHGMVEIGASVFFVGCCSCCIPCCCCCG